MSEDSQRIGAFYSKGPHFLRLLQFLRKQHPAARLVAVVPPGYPVAILAAHCDEVLVTEAERPSSPRALAGLVQQLRAARFDIFVVMFPSMRLRLVAIASGAGTLRYFTADSRYLPLSRNLLAGVGHMAWRNMRGRFTYARIWWIVHRQPVRK